MQQDNQSPLTNPEAVIDFWFGPQPGGFSDAGTRKRWFASDPAFDREISQKFGSLLQSAATGALAPWLDEAKGCLAFIVVTDQFSRQVHRGSVEAFATDPLALSAAREGVARGFDLALGYDQRAFFYLPFEHSESAEDQHTSVELFTHLAADTPGSHSHNAEETLRFALAHRDIVVQFGRFPHRNATLGRASTPAELEFLRTASRFGQ